MMTADRWRGLLQNIKLDAWEDNVTATKKTETPSEPDKKKAKKCFFVSPIGGDDSPQRYRSDNVLDYIITPALLECGYEKDNITRADRMSTPGRISKQVIQEVVESDLVIADLSDHNPNVFYELAVRHATRKPIVQIISAGQTIPFDVYDNRTIMYDHTDLRKADAAREAIKNQVLAVEDDPTLVDSPLHDVDLTFQLQSSKDPIPQALSQILDIVSKLEGQRQTAIVAPVSTIEDSRTLRITEVALQWKYISEKTYHLLCSFYTPQAYARSSSEWREIIRMVLQVKSVPSSNNWVLMENTQRECIASVIFSSDDIDLDKLPTKIGLRWHRFTD